MRPRTLALVAVVASFVLAGPASAMQWLDGGPGHVIQVPSDITAEATGSGGATVTYTVTVDPNDETATCSPASGSLFAIGTTQVTCTADDADPASFNVTVNDTTAPTVSAPASAGGTTTDHSGMTVTWPDATATDAVDGALPATCTPASGSHFPVGPTSVTCSATDSHNNTGSASFTVTVIFNDTTAPTFTPNPPPNISQNTPNPAGGPVTYSVSATDDSGSPPTVTCSPASGSTFPVGNTTVNCTAEDAAHNKATASFTVTLTLVDTTPPTFSNVPANKVIEANGPSGSIANYTSPTATDNLDGPIAVVSCSPASGTTFPLGTTTVICSASDSHGNVGHASFQVVVRDTTPPSLSVPGPTRMYATTPTGIPETEPAMIAFRAAASASDIVDPHPYITDNLGSFVEVGTHTVGFVARDASGNASLKEVTLTVLPQPSAGTPPLPTPPARTPPNDVTGLKAEAGDTRVRLSWQMPNGVDHVVITHQLSAGGDAQVVYTGSGESFTDRGLVNGLEYRYVVVSVNKSGDTSAGVAVVALPKATLLRSPKDGARLTKPPKLVWARNSEATYYNVQLFRGNLKILSMWPATPTLKLKPSWKYRGRVYRLKAGVYRWYVWPGFGARAAVDYGEMLGFSSFQIVR